MDTYVALLRGINVGGNKKVDMKELKKVFESLGFMNVSTYINSGNVLFEGTNPDIKIIEKSIEETFGFHVPTILRNRENIENICSFVPDEWENNDAMRTDIIFLWESIDTKDILMEIKQNPQVDTLIYTPGAVIWHLNKTQYKESKMHDFIGTRVYKNMTARNINTVRKLRELMNHS